MKRKRTNSKPRITAMHHDGVWHMVGSQYREPQQSPFIHANQVEAGLPCSLSVNFSIDGPRPFWSRQRFALRYWWLIASGKLEYAILSKVK
jgi:hypothetical protein